MVLFISRLLLCFLLCISLGFVVTGHPLPSTSNVPLDIMQAGPSTESDQATADEAKDLNYTFAVLRPFCKQLHYLKRADDSLDWTYLNMKQQEIDLVFGRSGHKDHSLRCRKNDQSNPEQNPLWPYEVDRLAGRTPHKGGGVGVVKMTGGLTLFLEEIRAQLQLQGCVSNSRKAVHYFKDKKYIEEIPHRFNSGTNNAWVEEKRKLRKEYVRMVLALYDEAAEIVTKLEATTAKPMQAKARVPTEVEWKLHRLFYNYCELYHFTYYTMRDAPPDLSIILIDGKRLCVNENGKVLGATLLDYYY
ncbi:hypothetical protein FB446DRAFT_376009 [Lentinula raphanica]|nr:hypothetical protein FB446DRAFT_376009 [Lentinula raphanica]